MCLNFFNQFLSVEQRGHQNSSGLLKLYCLHWPIRSFYHNEGYKLLQVGVYTLNETFVSIVLLPVVTHRCSFKRAR
jgi:hypothetical protein